MVQSLPDAELRAQTQRLLHGRFNHVAAAALAAVLVPLASVATSPALALESGSGGLSCDALGGHEITVNWNALDGHNIVEIGDRKGGPDPKYTICHFGQDHTGPDFIVAGPL
ncbi:MAG: hypothetical protein LH650_14975 [Chloroflexi bacterium]|nr:hypothetical protein [Chloroflexota bacterium]